jgi:phosphoketolase
MAGTRNPASQERKPMHATAPIFNATLSSEELEKINAYWSACNYLAAGMIFLREPLHFAYENVVDLPSADAWVWPY